MADCAHVRITMVQAMVVAHGVRILVDGADRPCTKPGRIAHTHFRLHASDHHHSSMVVGTNTGLCWFDVCARCFFAVFDYKLIRCFEVTILTYLSTYMRRSCNPPNIVVCALLLACVLHLVCTWQPNMLPRQSLPPLIMPFLQSQCITLHRQLAKARPHKGRLQQLVIAKTVNKRPLSPINARIVKMLFIHPNVF